ncbi:MAG TPA: hypothetical protein VEL74_18625 [Thermoanaerobaculia bacterium]|nr:hypothetical protein [Thermoanaerobaculia bacterium]
MVRRLAAPLALLSLLLVTYGVIAQDDQADTAAPVAATASQRAQVEMQLRLEQRLLVLDLAGYDEARTRERQALERMGEVATRLDETLGGDSLALGTLEALRDELDGAREAGRTAAGRVDAQIRRLEERLQRIGFLEGELSGRTAAAPRRTDVITGRWRVRVQPQDRPGTFELRLSGTVVTGTYSIEGGGSGSLQGTYAANRLRLERIDVRRGFDSVFEGTLTGSGVLTGTWTANELGLPEPAQGGWSAVRISSEDAGETADEDDAGDDGEP